MNLADVNGDSVPDIIVAPGPGRHALIQIYDGHNGQRLNSFHALNHDNPDPLRNFFGGADIATRKMEDAPGYEIVASQLAQSQFVRRFRQNESNDWVWVDGYNVFPDAPSVGVRVATGDVDGDGFDEIISVPGPGWIPQVAIHTSKATTSDGVTVYQRTENRRFLANVPKYRGGFNVAVADLDNDFKAEIFLTGANTGSSIDPFSGELRIFDTSRIPSNSEHRVVNPQYRIRAFSSEARGIGVHLLDADRNGVLERIDLSVTLGGNDDDRGKVRRFRARDLFEHVSTIFTSIGQFGAGIQI